MTDEYGKTPAEIAQDVIGDTAQAQQDFGQQVTRFLVGWVIRWTIGFAIIYGIVTWTGRYDWLWTAGMIIAGFSLLLGIGMAWLNRHLNNRIRNTAARLERALTEDEDDVAP